MCCPTQTLHCCQCENKFKMAKAGKYLRPNPYANILSSSLSSPFLSKNLSGLKVKGSEYTLSSCVMALDVCISSCERNEFKKARHILACSIVPIIISKQ